MAETNDDFLNLLEEGLSKLGIDREDRILSLLARYIEEIELFNPAYGLVKVKDRRELIVKHIFDSLAPLNILFRLLSETPRTVRTEGNVKKIADAGSGAGLPGIPLAICMPGAEFTLIERMGRRAGFLRDAIAVLGLPNVRVEEAEMERFALKPSVAGSFELVVFRAFRSLEPVILKGLSNLLAPNGFLAAYKGRRESIEEEMARFRKKAWEVFPLEVPFLEEERHLLLVRPGGL